MQTNLGTILAAAPAIAGLSITGFALLRLAAIRSQRLLQQQIPSVAFDAAALAILRRQSSNGPLRIIATEPLDLGLASAEVTGPQGEYQLEAVFLEVIPASASGSALAVHGVEQYGYHILRVCSRHIPEAIAAVALHVRDLTGQLPRIDFAWPRTSHTAHVLRFLLAGSGQVAPQTREILRRIEPNALKRPKVHIGP